MLPMELRKKVVADYEDGMPVPLISQVMRVSQSAIYRILAKKRETGSIEAMLSREEMRGRCNKIGRNGSIMEALVIEKPDITLAEIKEAMNLSIQKSEISNILRQKLGFRFKKRWFMPASGAERTL